jgi:hypothetical protein
VPAQDSEPVPSDCNAADLPLEVTGFVGSCEVSMSVLISLVNAAVTKTEVLVTLIMFNYVQLICIITGKYKTLASGYSCNILRNYATLPLKWI